VHCLARTAARSFHGAGFRVFARFLQPRAAPVDFVEASSCLSRGPVFVCYTDSASEPEERAPMSLAQAINDSTKKPAIIQDCVKLVDEEVASKSGLSGLAVKAGYAAVKGVKPGFIAEVVDKLMKDFAEQLDPFWVEGKKGGDPVGHLVSNKAQVADALLSVTDGKAKGAKSSVVRGTYEKLRGSAKRNVEDAMPRLARLLEKHAG
jgi:hypothetical protein